MDKVESLHSHHPPLETMQIIDMVTSLSREDAMYWKSIHRPSPPEAAQKLEESLDRLHALVVKKEKRLDHVSVAMMIHQVAALSAASNLNHQVVRHGLVKRLLYLADKCQSRFDANHIANILWAMGKMGRTVLFVRIGETKSPAIYLPCYGGRSQNIPAAVSRDMDLLLTPGFAEELEE